MASTYGSTYGKSKKKFAKKDKKHVPHYITKEDIKAKPENQSWDKYFEVKEGMRKLRNKNANKKK